MKTKTATLRKTLDCNTIFDGRFIHAGEILSADVVARLPENLRRHLVEPESAPAAAAEGPTIANFQLGVPYRLDHEGRMVARDVERQAAQQAFEADYHDSIVEQLQEANESLDETVAAAVEAAREDHEGFVNLQIAEASARRIDEEHEHLAAVQDEAAARADFEGYSPPLDEEETAEPAPVERISSATVVDAEPAPEEADNDEWEPGGETKEKE